MDFFCEEARLAIELDGGGHADEEQLVYDAARTEELSRRKVRLLRFWNNDVIGNLEGVLQRIREALALSPPSP